MLIHMHGERITIYKDIRKRHLHWTDKTRSPWVTNHYDSCRRKDNGPVSYTHLDVYKRQGFIRPNPFRNVHVTWKVRFEI